jgi:hypothetical protein
MGMAVTERRRRVLCARETSLYPHTVLRTRQAARVCAPVRLRCGGGAAHGHHQGRSLSGQEQEQASNHTRRVRARGLCAPERSLTPEVPHGSARGSGSPQGDPGRRQARRLSSLRTDRAMSVALRAGPLSPRNARKSAGDGIATGNNRAILTLGERRRDRTRRAVSTCHRRPGPV